MPRREGEPGAAKERRGEGEMWIMLFRLGYLWRSEAAMWCSEVWGMWAAGVMGMFARGWVRGVPVVVLVCLFECLNV